MIMSEKLLTVCTAAYNAEKYIDFFFESILACKNKDLLEIIIVNDGSTDGTRIIAEDYASRYPDIIKVINKENGGSGSARNVAFKKAVGKYIKLIDADDFVVTSNLEKYLDKLKFVESDVVWNGSYKKYERKNVTEKYDFSEGYLIPDKRYDLLNDTFFLPVDYEMHGVTYKTSLIQENNIKLSEGLPYVDLEYLMLPIPFAKSVIYINMPFYVYRLELPGQSVDPAIQSKKEPQFKKIANRLIDYYKKSNQLSINNKTIMMRVASKACVGIYSTYYIRGEFRLKNDMVKIDREIKKIDEEIWKEIGNASGSARLFRKVNYMGYYPMIIYNRLKHWF